MGSASPRPSGTSATKRVAPAALTPRQSSEAAALRLLRSIVRATRQHMQLIEEHCGVPGAQIWMMAELARSPGIRVSDLADALTVHQSTVSNLLLKLEERGYVTRERSADDQRVVRLRLTRAGAAVLGRAPKPLEGAVETGVRAMTSGELAQLHQGLARLAARMGAEAESGSALQKSRATRATPAKRRPGR